MLKILEDYPDAQARTHELFAKALQGETIKLEQYESARTDEAGNTRYYDLNIAPIRKPGGEVLGGALTNREITHKIVAARQMESIIERSANLTGDDFFKNLTEQITDLFQAKYTYIGLLDRETEQVHTQALRVNGKLSQNFSYGLQDVPCQAVASPR